MTWLTGLGTHRLLWHYAGSRPASQINIDRLAAAVVGLDEALPCDAFYRVTIAEAERHAATPPGPVYGFQHAKDGWFCARHPAGSAAVSWGARLGPFQTYDEAYMSIAQEDRR